MMKNISVLFLFLLPACLHAQDELSLDLLKAPGSPGFILLDKEPSSIERPTNPTDFMVSLRNATDDFSTLPKNYAVELAPFWLFGGKNISFSDMMDSSGNMCNAMKQTLSLSVAINTAGNELISKTQLGIGIKFSIIRGPVSEEFLKANGKRMEVLRNIEKDFHEEEGYKKIQSKYRALRKDTTLNQEAVSIDEDIETNNYQEARMEGLQKKYEKELENLSKTKLTRSGWGLDVAGGFVTDFPNQVFEEGVIPKYGAWLTLSYACDKNISFLLLARELFQKDESYADKNDNIRIADLNHTDGGIRMIIDKSRFSFSLEGLFRFTGGGDDLKSENKNAWKLMFNAGYDLGNNKIITFNLGRDFDGTVSKDGNIIAALNLVLGFGSSRNISN